jgi:O-antigen ligase
MTSAAATPPQPSTDRTAFQPVLAAGIALLAAAGALTALRLTGSSRVPAAAVVAGGAAAVWLLGHPRWLVPVFIALTWSLLEGSGITGLSSAATRSSYLLGAVALVAFPRNRQAGLMAILCAAAIGIPMIASGLVAGSLPKHAVSDLVFIAIPALLIAGDRDVDRAALALTVLGIGLSIGAIYSVRVHPTGLFPLDQAPTTAGPAITPRAAGPFGESNFFALSLAVLVPFAVHVVPSGSWRRLLGLVALPLLLAGLLSTGSRGGLIAAAVALVVSGLAARRTARPAVLAGALVTAVVVIAAGVSLFSAQLQDAQSRTLDGRSTENKIALAMFADHPLLGVGPGNYPTFYRDYARRIGNDARDLREPHSLPLEIAAEQGVAGLLGWAAMLVALVGYALRRRVHRRPAGRTLLIALATYATGSLFLHGSVMRLAYLLIGMLIALAGASREAQLR